MKIKLNKSQDRAVNALRGLPTAAHYLVMCSEYSATGSVLDGSEEAFRELVEHISMDLAEGMVPARDVEPLASLCLKIDPDCAEWLGQ